MKTEKIFSSIFLISFLLLGCDSVTQNNLGDKIAVADRYNEIISLANPKNESNGLILESIKSDNVEMDGTSNKWTYSFTSGGIAVTYYYHATSESVAFDSISKFVKLPRTQLISHNWMNSTNAIKIAENNGGEFFRLKNNKYNIETKLEEPLGYNKPTYWYITYYSKSDITIRMSFVIDATTGEIKN